MNETRSMKVVTLVLLLFLLLAVNVGNLIAAEISDADQKIINAGVKKAKELGLNPVPMCEEENGNKFIPAGFVFNISNGGFSLKNGDMLINATKGTITAVGVPLDRGEYAAIENNKAKKGESNLVSE